MDKEEMTVKQTRGTVGERQIAYVNALKAVDYEKEYQQALRDIAEAMFDMTDEDFENNEVKSVENAKS
jgi:hypothetical protein